MDTTEQEKIKRSERLKQMRKSLGLTQGEFGKKIRMSDVAISHMESGRTNLSDQNIQLICLTFGARVEWLKDGSGEMMDEEATLSDYERRLMDRFGKLSPKAQDMLIEYAEKLRSDEQALRGGEPGKENPAAGNGTEGL